MPATVNPDCIHLSASSIASFKACPVRFRLAYREGLRPAQDTESQRMGTNWHAMHETWANCVQTHGSAEAIRMEAVVQHLNERYAEVPSYKTAEEWALERQILLTSFIGYQWYWQNDPVEFLVSELPFELPIHNPTLGLPLPVEQCVRVGKIDHVVKWQGGVCALERKSTSRGIGADSDYWDKAKKDTQVSMYALAFRDMVAVSMLPTNLASTDRLGGTLYDVWHKPTTKPKPLTQADTAAFIESGEYCGQPFEVRLIQDGDLGDCSYTVNGTPAVIEQGKKGFAIRETVEMYGARLLQDIYERPDFYFARREIARTDAEIRGFREQLWAVYQAQRAYIRHNTWFENESACRATFPCVYIPVCYGAGANAVCDGRTTPAGFKRLFTVDLTINGVTPDEE